MWHMSMSISKASRRDKISRWRGMVVVAVVAVQKKKRETDLLNVISGDVVGVVGCHHGLHLHQVLLHLSHTQYIYIYIHYMIERCTLSLSLTISTFSIQNQTKLRPAIVQVQREAHSLSLSLSLWFSGFLCVPTFPFYLLAIAMMLPHGNKILESVNRKWKRERRATHTHYIGVGAFGLLLFYWFWLFLHTMGSVSWTACSCPSLYSITW